MVFTGLVACAAYAIALLVSLASACEKDFTVFNSSNFSSNNTYFGSNSGSTFTPEGAIFLTNKRTENVPSQAWMKGQYNILNGFEATFTFDFSGKADGLAFVIHNSMQTSTAGGIGDDLGYLRFLENYFGVSFVACHEAKTPCHQRISFNQRDKQKEVELGSKDGLSLVKTGQNNTFRIKYLNENTVSLYVNEDENALISAELGDTSGGALNGSSMATIGFSSSTSLDPLVSNTIIYSLKFTVPRSEYELTDDYGHQVVYWGDSAIFYVRRVNDCGDTIPPLKNETVKAQLKLMKDDDYSNYDPKSARVIIIDLDTSNVEFTDDNIKFWMPMNKSINGPWDLTVTVNGLDLDNSPVVNAVRSEKPQLRTLPLWALILIIVVCVIIVVAIVYGVYRFVRYKRKLRKHKEFIGAGKQKEYLDNLELEVMFDENPLKGSSSDLLAQLKKNEADLDRLHGMHDKQNNKRINVSRLQAENEQLRKQMNYLKMQEQRGAAMDDPAFSAMENPAMMPIKARKQFDDDEEV